MRNTLVAGLLVLSAASAFAQDGSRPQRVAAANHATPAGAAAPASAPDFRAHVLTREE